MTTAASRAATERFGHELWMNDLAPRTHASCLSDSDAGESRGATRFLIGLHPTNRGTGGGGTSLGSTPSSKERSTRNSIANGH